MWRSYYLSFLPGFSTKLRVMLNWLFDAILPRNTVQVQSEPKGGARYVHYLAGDRIWERDNRADGFYTILEGKVEFRIPDGTGGEIVRILGPGDHFGERVLLGTGLRTGTTKALEDTKVVVLAPEDFLRMTNAFPPLKDYFDRHIARVLAQAPEQADNEIVPAPRAVEAPAP